MYYIKYNEIDLTDLVKVRSVEIPSLPSIEHSSYDVFERHGNIYNGASYNNREINLVLLIYPDRPEGYDPNNPVHVNNMNDTYDMYVNDVKRAFYTKEECRLFCGNEELYMWCVPVGDITITELGVCCAEIEVDLIAYDPYWYSTKTNCVNNYNRNTFQITNNSDLAVYPTLQIGMTKNTTFVQIQNQTNGKTILIGGIPSVEGEVVERNTNILSDPCENTSGWTATASAPIESGRTAGGSITVNNGGWGFVLSRTGGGDTTWKGAACRKQLNQPVKDFKVRVGMTHNSGGTNGDPSRPYENNYEQATSGSKTTYYQVTADSGLILRKEASTSSEKLCTIPYGTKLTGTLSNGWLRTTYSGKTGYCYSQYLKKITSDSTTTTSQCNMVTNKATAIRNTPYKTAKNNGTIPAGTLIRVIFSEKYPAEHENSSLKNIFYKLAKPYNGASGYVLIEDVAKASDYEVDYEEEQRTADDKTGVVELYGFSSNNIQLFKLSMNDKSEYYEHTYPSITKNGKVFLEDSANTPNPKTHTDYNDSGKKVENVLSGKVVNGWQEFNGELYIERINNVWSAYVQNKKNGSVTKEIKSSSVTDTTNGNEQLSYLVMYFGTTQSGSSDGTLEPTNKCSDMSIAHIEVKTGTEIDNRVEYNVIEFGRGDVLTINCSIPSVRLNDVECNELVDIGSSFFELEPGENTIKIASDDTPNIDVLWIDKRL